LLSNYENDINTSSIIRFIERICIHLNKRFPDDELNDFTIFDINAINNSVKDFDFGKPEIERLIKKYEHLIGQSNTSKIYQEYLDLKFLIIEKYKNKTFKTFDDVLKFVLNSSDFNNISIILDIIGTFEASSVDCERGFSLMNAIKSK